MIVLPKPKIQSKTLWVNYLALAAALLTVVAGSPVVAEYPRAASGIAAALAAVNVALRFLTVVPLE